jgi:hypothetical protein
VTVGQCLLYAELGDDTRKTLDRVGTVVLRLRMRRTLVALSYMPGRNQKRHEKPNFRPESAPSEI